VKTEEYLIGQPRLQTMAGFEYLSASAAVPRAEMVSTIHSLGPVVERALGRGQAKSAGWGVVTYRDGSQPNTLALEVGEAVQPGGTAAAGLELRQVPPYRCLSTVLCGSYRHLGKAWDALGRELKACGLRHAGEDRELYLYCEGDDSPNNVVLVQVGVEDGGAAAEPETQIGEMTVRTLAGFDLFCVPMQTTHATIPQAFGDAWPLIWPAAEQAGARLLGPEVAVYLDASTPGVPFTLLIGQKVASGTCAAGRAEVRSLAPFRCASLIYSGGIPQGLGPAIEALHSAFTGRGLRCTGEYREYYLYWEGRDSPNNVMLLQFGVEE
jgi:effector-binding domain-containing protein